MTAPSGCAGLGQGVGFASASRGSGGRGSGCGSMMETVHWLNDDLKLSVSEEREDKYKLVFRNGASYIYFSEEEYRQMKDVIES